MLEHVNEAIRILTNYSSQSSVGAGKILPSAYHTILRKPITAIVATVLKGNQELDAEAKVAFDGIANAVHLDRAGWLLLANTPGVGRWPLVNIPLELAQDPAQFDSLRVALMHLAGSANLIDRLLAGRDDVELTPKEIAYLAAHIHNNRPHASWWQQQNQGVKCPELERYQKLKTILDFNRNLQATSVSPAPDQATGNAGSTAPPAKTKTGEEAGAGCPANLIDALRRVPVPQSYAEIADTARLIYTCYRDGAADYHRAKKNLEFTRNLASKATPSDQPIGAFPAKGSSLDNAQRDYGCSLDYCREMGQTVENLGHAVAQRLPALWPSLRLVGGVSRWYENEDFDWDSAIDELRQIEAAARSADLTPPVPNPVTGKTSSTSPAAKLVEGGGNGGAEFGRPVPATGEIMRQENDGTESRTPPDPYLTQGLHADGRVTHHHVTPVVSPPEPKANPERLRRCARELRALFETAYSPSMLSKSAGELVWQAYLAGAFERDDSAFNKLRACIIAQYVNFSGKTDVDWRGGAFSEAVICLAPQFSSLGGDKWKDALPIIATTIEREATRMEQPVKSEGTGGADQLTEQPLGERAQLVLTVLRNEKAFDSDHRKTTSDIAVKAAGKQADPNQFKEVIADLKRFGYVDTKEGRSGGCWLTTAGQRRANKL